MKRNTAPHNDTERSRVGHTTTAKGEDRESDFRARKQIGNEVRARFEMDPDGTRNQSGRDRENDAGGQAITPCTTSNLDSRSLSITNSSRLV